MKVIALLIGLIAASEAATSFYPCGFNCGKPTACGSCTDWNNSTNWCGKSQANCETGCSGNWCPDGPASKTPFYRCGYGCGGKCPTAAGGDACTTWDDSTSWCGQSAEHCDDPRCKNGLWCPNGKYPEPTVVVALAELKKQQQQQQQVKVEVEVAAPAGKITACGCTCDCSGFLCGEASKAKSLCSEATSHGITNGEACSKAQGTLNSLAHGLAKLSSCTGTFSTGGGAAAKVVTAPTKPEAGKTDYYTCGYNCPKGCGSCTDWNNVTGWCGQSSDNCEKGCAGQWCPDGPDPTDTPFYRCGYNCFGQGCPTPESATCTDWDDNNSYCGQSAGNCGQPRCKNGIWCPEGRYPEPTVVKALKQLKASQEKRAAAAAARAAEAALKAADTPVCSMTEYCCPDAKKCLTSTKTSCAADATACGAGEVCCPVTKTCVKPGKACDTTCHVAGNKWGIMDYCSPTQHYAGFDSYWCATPTDPGVFCAQDSDCKNDKWTGAKCDAVTSLCVTVREACQLP